jgi:hypothetical protein
MRLLEITVHKNKRIITYVPGKNPDYKLDACKGCELGLGRGGCKWDSICADHLPKTLVWKELK